MPRPWDAPLARLRRRALAAAALTGLQRGLAPAVLVALGYLGLASVSPWARYFAPEAVVALGVLLVGAAGLALVRARRGRSHWAKWLDLSSQLDDRLASACEWELLAAPGEFERACVEQLERDLRAQPGRLRLPRTLPTRLGATAAGLALLGVVGVLLLRTPAPQLESDARQRVRLPHTVASHASDAAQKLSGDARALDDVQLEVLTSDLSTVVQRLEAGTLDRERALATLEDLRKRAARTGGARLDTVGDGGPVGALAKALASGGAAAVAHALDAVTAALSSGALGDTDQARLRSLVSSLAGQAEQQHAGELSGRLRDAERRLAAGDAAGAAATLGRSREALAARSMAAAVAVGAAAEQVARVAASLERTLDGQATDARSGEILAELDAARTASAPPGTSAAGMPPGQHLLPGTQGAGDNTSGEHPPGTPPPTAPPGPELQLAGVWDGKIMHQLFEGAGDPGDDARRLLVEHERVAEERFQKDEIPAEYSRAVRAYFAQLHQRGGPWVPSRK